MLPAMKPATHTASQVKTDNQGRPVRGGWGAAGVVAAVVAAICYINTLGNGFVYDDIAIVRDNPRIRSLANLAEIWTSEWWQPPDADQEAGYRRRDRLYRPLTMTTIALDYAVGGDSPVGYHAVNLLLHALTAALVWRLTKRMWDDSAIASVAAVLFAVHPVHVEAVANVVGRAELLAAFFMLLSLLTWLPAAGPPTPRRAVGAAVLFLAALASKETAVCFVPVALIAAHALHRRSAGQLARKWLVPIAILLVPLVIYLPMRFVALDHHLVRDLPPSIQFNPLRGADWPARLLASLTILGHYTRLLLFPVQLSSNYGLAVIDPDRGPEVLTLVGGLAALGLVVALIGYRRASAAWRRFAVAAAMFLASYVLISNTFLLIGVSLAERLLYWPSVPLLLGLAVGIVHLWRRAVAAGVFSPAGSMLARLVGVFVLVALGARSFDRNHAWYSNSALFGQDARTYPQSAALNIEWARELARTADQAHDRERAHGLFSKADLHLEIALRIDPGAWNAMQLRGQVLDRLGDRARAIEYLELAARSNPLDTTSARLLAALRDADGQAARRADQLTAQIATRPADASLRIAYASLLLQAGRFREALAEAQQAARLEPDNPRALRVLGDAYAGMNEPEPAIKALERALTRRPDDWQIHVNLANLLASRDPAAALRHAQEAWRLAPENREAGLALAEMLSLNRQPAAAIELFKRIQRATPANDPLQTAIGARIREIEQGRP
jgi:protein O-mannosyl-transferase